MGCDHYYHSMTITLPPALDQLVQHKVASGLFADASEVIGEALRRQYAGDEVMDWVRNEACRGFEQLDAGESVELTREELFRHLHQRHAA